MNGGDAFLVVGGTVDAGHSHQAEADPRDFGAAAAERGHLHLSSLNGGPADQWLRAATSGELGWTGSIWRPGPPVALRPRDGLSIWTWFRPPRLAR